MTTSVAAHRLTGVTQLRGLASVESSSPPSFAPTSEAATASGSNVSISLRPGFPAQEERPMDLGILIFRCSCALPMPSRFALTRWYVVEWWTPQAHRVSSIWYFAMKGCADITPHCDGASPSHSFRSALDWSMVWLELEGRYARHYRSTRWRNGLGQSDVFHDRPAIDVTDPA